jgi:tetratricopeptide (TPR) repeat protein
MPCNVRAAALRPAQSCDLVDDPCNHHHRNRADWRGSSAGTRLALRKAVLGRLAILTLCLLPFAPGTLLAQTARELNDSAWKLLQSGDAARAGKLFAEALTKEPNQPVLLLGAGVAAHLQGRSKEATVPLRRALDLDPRLTPASILLGQIAYTDGDVANAITIYEKALTHAPDDPHLTAKLKAWRADAEASSGFTERRFDRFRVMFQGHADNALAARATEILDAAFWRIGKALGAYPSEPVVVMLYTEQQFRDITQAPTWAGGIYDGRIRVPAAGAVQSPQLFERVLVHELTHAMIATIAPRGIPTWLHEGLAQHFEGDDAVAARRRVERIGVIPLRYLEGSFSRLTAPQAALAYDESLVVVDNLFRRPGMDWNALFRALSESDRTEYTFDSFGLRYSTLEAEITPAR